MGEEANKAEFGQLSSRCSVRQLHDVISKLDLKKKQLVESLGFGGLLYFPHLKQMNRKFSAWLLSRVDVMAQSIVVDEGRRLTFTKEDVRMVFGVPASGINVTGYRSKNNHVIKKFMKEVFGENNREQRTIRNLQEVIERDLEGMTVYEEDCFCIAFVAFVVSTLFAPGAKHDHVSVDCWDALEDPRSIRMFDWSAYVVERLFGAVLKFKTDLRNNIKSPNVAGCSIFLQFFYLDSIDLGEYNLEHNIFPRIRCFTSGRLRGMITADTVNLHGNTIFPDFGKSKLRKAAEVCYTWGAQAHVGTVMNARCKHGVLWQATVLMARFLGVPIEATGLLYFAMEEFQRKAFVCVGGVDSLELISSLICIMEPYLKGFNYLPSSGLVEPAPLYHTACCFVDGCENVHTIEKHSSDLFSSRKRRKAAQLGNLGMSSCVGLHAQGMVHDVENGAGPWLLKIPSSSGSKEVGVPMNVVESTHDFSSCCADLSSFVAKVMAKFYLSCRSKRLQKCLDLNLSDGNGDQHCEEKRIRCNCKLLPQASVWGLGLNLPAAKERSLTILTKLRLASVSNQGCSPCFAHHTPKYIEVIPAAVKLQILGDCEMDIDMFDIIVRRIKQIDECYNSHHLLPRWRHIVEAEFVCLLIAGTFDIAEPFVFEQFRGQSVRYDIRQCEMIFFPAIVQHRWVCYAWRIKESCITIFDPTLRDGQADLLHLHGKIINGIKVAMNDVCEHILGGWRHAWSEMRVCMCSWSNNSLDSVNRTGILCAYYYLSHNGVDSTYCASKELLDIMAAYLFEEAVHLEDNTGSLAGYCV